MPHSWNTISNDTILKRKTIYEKLFKHTIQNWSKYWTNKSRRRYGPRRHAQRSSKNDGQLIMELIAIQVIAVGVLILSYIGQELL